MWCAQERPSGFTTEIELYVANDGVTFRQARLSTSLPQNGYYILDSSEGAVFLHVMVCQGPLVLCCGSMDGRALSLPTVGL